MMENDTREYVVQNTRHESPTTVTLSLSLKEEGIPTHIPGQFINVYFSASDTPEGKAYSISSAPNGKDFSITVRGIGTFSNRLCALRVGDTLSASLPYGFFCPERGESDLVLIASGIGVTPFRSIIEHSIQNRSERKIALLHTVRTYEDMFFRNEFVLFKKENPRLLTAYFVTQEKDVQRDVISRRMTTHDVIVATREMYEPEFLICGSISFTGDMWKALKQSGVQQDSIYTEAFFSH
jgi:ferredoxin-NADP reductase